MSWTEKEATSADAWHQIEKLVDQLHELARTPIDQSEFYRALLDGCVTMLAADGGAVWQKDATGRWNTVHQVRIETALAEEQGELTSLHHQLLERIASSNESLLLPPESGSSTGLENPTHSTILAGRVPGDSAAATIIELFFPAGYSPEVQEGWQELLETVRQIAADYHGWDDYRRLRT